jgi:hypothetical protein
MADDDDTNTGPIVSGEVAPAPHPPAPDGMEWTDQHLPDQKSREQIVKDQFDKGLMLSAFGTEDASDYAREREAQDRHLAGEDLSPAQMREWHERAHASLQRALDAQARARGEVPPSQQQAPQERSGYIAPDAPHYDEHMAAAQERFSRYFDDPNNIGDQNTAAEHKKAVTDWLTTYDPRGELTGYYMASELGPQIAEALANEPQVIPYLLGLPPQQQAREMAKLEGYLHARMMQAQAAPKAPEPRKVTQAPPPIRPPSGGANPPKDLFRLADRDNVDDYVKMRRQQERCAREDEWR